MSSQKRSAPRYRIRRARLSDIDQLVQIEQASWEAACDPEDMFTADQFRRHITCVGKYIFVAVERRSKRVLGYVSALRVPIPLDEVEDRVANWHKLTNEGWYTPHDPAGQAMFGASLGVLPEYQRFGIGDRLIEAEFKRIVREGIEYGFLGGRLPGLKKYLEEHPEATAEDYFVLKRPDGKYFDPELRFYADDFQIRKLLPGYFRDEESCDHGVLLVWPNPFNQTKLPPAIAAPVFKAILYYYHAKAWWQRK